MAPLTGLTVSAAAAQRPAVAVAVSGSAPVGLGAADLVLEEMTAPVRYLAVFQSAQASQVGPVAATRPTDGQALSVLHPVTGYDGGTSSFISVLDASKVVDASYARHASAYASGSAGLTVSTSATFDTFAPIGPHIVSADEIADPHALDISLHINGELLQHSNTRELIFKIPELVAFISSVVTLEPGDIVSTGTPAGVGAAR